MKHIHKVLVIWWEVIWYTQGLGLYGESYKLYIQGLGLYGESYKLYIQGLRYMPGVTKHIHNILLVW